MYPTLPIVKQPVANSNIAQVHNSLFIRFLFFIRFLTKETLYLKSLFFTSSINCCFSNTL
ncbi:hypothetical protein LEP1GSC151_5865 [Leptospira interrogans serovar Grippotyphosa str. LT2186]|uniref:Uncharacterized protein n=1 Tax=Leptospira interrogans serovar Grippotyphosa str. LT2186 TaxID=1001599 RepID=M3H378_LEPIR|nr:hypothetical protein LEP1GSC151_5865 [Leptospira interrogans serovar Grippotyphosa str. LT2186]